MFRKRRILLWVSENSSHGRDIVRGVLQLARHRPESGILRQPPDRKIPSAHLLAKADGAITCVSRTLTLAGLAPDMVEAVLADAGLADLSVARLVRDLPLR